MDNDDWTSAAHNRAIGWREAELMREVQTRWRERGRDGRGAWQMGVPWFLSAGAQEEQSRANRAGTRTL